MDRGRGLAGRTGKMALHPRPLQGSSLTDPVRAGAVLLITLLGALGCTGSVGEDTPATAAGGAQASGGGSPGDGGAHAAGAGSGGGPAGAGGEPGGTGGGAAGSGGDSPPRPTTPAAFGACPKGGGEPGVSPLMKLSTIQYRNTVRDLLAASGLGAVATEVAPMLAAIPDDSTVAFRGLDARISTDHVQGYFNVAIAVADAATNTSQRLTTLGRVCAATSPLDRDLPRRVPRLIRQARACAGPSSRRAQPR